MALGSNLFVDTYSINTYMEMRLNGTEIRVTEMENGHSMDSLCARVVGEAREDGISLF